MTITDVRVRKIAKEGKMKAIVSITVDDEFVVHDIKVIEGREPGKRSRELFWKHTIRHWKNRLHNFLNKYRK